MGAGGDEMHRVYSSPDVCDAILLSYVTLGKCRPSVVVG